MNGVRALRIGGIALVLSLLFQLSQAVSAAGGQEQVHGIEWALGAMALLFFLRALASEASGDRRATLQNDVQWGVSLGLVGTIVARLWE
jgi:di/tricarboxylate transporter